MNPTKLFERMMSLDEYLALGLTSGEVLIRHKDENPRAMSIKEKLNARLIVELTHEMETSSQSSTNANIVDKISVYINGKLDDNFTSTNLDQMFCKLSQHSSSLFFDITNIGTRLMGLLCSSLAECFDKDDRIFSSVFFGYTEPKDYNRNNNMEIKLYQSFDPMSPLPKLLSEGSSRAEQIWIVLLGFEGNRVNSIQEEIGHIDDIVATLTVPSLKLGWVNSALEANAHFLQGVEREQRPTIKYISARSPFAAYNFLCEFQSKHKKSRLQVSPLGTKANSLGVIMYAINNKDCAFIFDNPVENTRPEEEPSNITHVYEMTQAFRYIRSKN